MIKEELLTIADEASIQILDDEKALCIKQVFRLGDKSMAGMLLFLLLGCFFIFMPFFKPFDTASRIIVSAVAFLLILASILTLIKQVKDRVRIADGLIAFRYNLKYHSLPLEKGMKVKMKTEFIEIRRVDSMGSDYIMVTHYIQRTDKEVPILRFTMDAGTRVEAVRLGNEITQMINRKIREFVD